MTKWLQLKAMFLQTNEKRVRYVFQGDYLPDGFYMQFYCNETNAANASKNEQNARGVSKNSG